MGSREAFRKLLNFLLSWSMGFYSTITIFHFKAKEMVCWQFTLSKVMF